MRVGVCVGVCLLGFGSLGCGGSAKKVEGPWAITGPMGNMSVNFKSDGTYDGTITGRIAGPMKGTYTQKGEVLEMGAPTVTVNGQDQTPPGGTMVMKLTWQGDDAIKAKAGALDLTFTRLAAPVPVPAR